MHRKPLLFRKVGGYGEKEKETSFPSIEFSVFHGVCLILNVNFKARDRANCLWRRL